MLTLVTMNKASLTQDEAASSVFISVRQRDSLPNTHSPSKNELQREPSTQAGISPLLRISTEESANESLKSLFTHHWSQVQLHERTVIKTYFKTTHTHQNYPLRLAHTLIGRLRGVWVFNVAWLTKAPERSVWVLHPTVLTKRYICGSGKEALTGLSPDTERLHFLSDCVNVDRSGCRQQEYGGQTRRRSRVCGSYAEPEINGDIPVTAHQTCLRSCRRCEENPPAGFSSEWFYHKYLKICDETQTQSQQESLKLGCCWHNFNQTCCLILRCDLFLPACSGDARWFSSSERRDQDLDVELCWCRSGGGTQHSLHSALLLRLIFPAVLSSSSVYSS